MDRQELKDVLEESGIPAEKIDEVFYALEQTTYGYDNDSDHPPVRDETIDLKLSLMNEDDWRKRASIAAQIISKNLE